MAAPSYGEVNKRLQDAMMSKVAPDVEGGGAAPEAAPAPQLTPDDKVAAAVGMKAMEAAAPPKEEGPSTLSKIGSGLADVFLGLLPQAAAYATGGSEALEKQRQVEKEAAARQDEINKKAAELAAQAKKLELEQKKAMSDEDYKKQELKIKQMEADTHRLGLDNKNPTDFDGKLKKLNATEKTRFDNVRMGYQSITDMANALKAGNNTFSLIGDNDYTLAARNFEEALGRMQSGGAINKDEAARFRSLIPSAKDSAAIQATKLKKMQEELASRFETLGFKPQEVPGLNTAKVSDLLVKTANADEAPKMSLKDRARALGHTMDQVEQLAKEKNISVDVAIQALERKKARTGRADR